MPRKYRSRRSRLAALTNQLRRDGQTWAQIAVRIGRDEHVNARVAMRLAHGLSQQAVADRWNELFVASDGASLAAKQVSYWETWPESGREPSLEDLRRLAQIYQCDVGDLVENGSYRHLDEVQPQVDRGKVADRSLAAARAGLPDIYESGDLATLLQLSGADDDEVMKRRAFLLSMAAAGIGTSDPATAWETARHELNRTLAGASERAATDVDEWHEIALEYGQTYTSTPPAELLDTLMLDLFGLQAVLRRYPDDTTGRELRQVGALLAAFTAQTVANLGHLRQAGRWWRTARRAADQASDAYSALWIRGREIIRAGYEHRPTTVVLSLIEEAEARLDHAPDEVAPRVLAGKAQTMALMGREADAERSLEQVRDSFSSLPTATASPSGSLFSWGEECLHFTESFVYSHLGDVNRADRAQRAALPLYVMSDVRQPAQLELHRAMCLVRSGDVAEGTRHAQAVITGLPAAQRIRPIVDLGRTVLGAIPAAQRDRPGVQEYRDWLGSCDEARANQLTAS